LSPDSVEHAPEGRPADFKGQRAVLKRSLLAKAGQPTILSLDSALPESAQIFFPGNPQ